MKTILAALALVLMSHSGIAQKEINTWCFPTNSGFDFNNGPPVTISSVMASGQQEGCSSISDSAGNLLFYTDGAVVRDRTHAIMPNGGLLLGSYTTTQGALIVKQPGNPNIYFVFTIDMQNGPNGLRYSVVDMNLNGGMGDLVQSNLQLSPGIIFSEKMIGIRHTNDSSVWVVTHESFTAGFYCYLVSSAGLDTVPVITHIGQNYGSNDAVGSMHCTLDGSRIAAAYWDGLSGYEVFDFDKSNGTLSNPLFISDPSFLWAYSVCFSPGGRYLYGGCYNSNQVFQIDLQQPVPTWVLIANTIFAVGDMQIGPDSNIYVALNGHGFMGAITEPDSAGLACNFNENFISLNGNTGNIGITNFVYPSLNLQPAALFTAPHHICPGTCTNFNNLSQLATSYFWLLQGAIPDTSSAGLPNVCYFTPGTYDVTLIASNAYGSDTTTLPNYITVYPYSPPLSISQTGDTLFANAGFSTYQWFNDGDTIPGATAAWYLAPQSGDYSVICLDDNGCSIEAVVLNVIAEVQSPVASRPSAAIYPNPVSNQFTILDVQCLALSLPKCTFKTAGRIIIRNVTGREVLETSYENSSYIKVDELSPGIYFVEIDGDLQTFFLRFIKL